MKLLCLFVLVAVLAALCSAQPARPSSLDDAVVLRSKRQAVLINGLCPAGQSRLRGRCVSCNIFEEATGRPCPGNIKSRRF